MLILNDTQEIFSRPINGVIDQCEENLLRVKALGSIWSAQLHASCPQVSLNAGQAVTVVGRSGIQLIITPQDCNL